MTLYVYCLLESGEIPGLAGIEGIQKQQPIQRAMGAFQAVASPFSGRELQPDKENVLAHERVIDACMAVGALLPFRFGTVVAEEMLASFAATQETALRANFDKVRGCVEMGVKVSWPEAVTEAAPETAPATEGPGARFLRAKQRKYESGKQSAAWVNDAVADLLRDWKSSPIGKNGSMVRIAHLVPVESLELYRERLGKHLGTRPDGAFLRSGPWPPYSFVSAGM